MPEPNEQPTDHEPPDDAAILSKLVLGDALGLRQLLQAYGGVIRARLRRDFGVALDDSELDEAMGAMTVKVWNAATRYNASKGTLRGWALVIARNSALRVLEQRRRCRLRLEGDMDRWAALAGAVTPSAIERARILIEVRDCVAQLPTLQRAILEADLLAGEPVVAETLAERFGTSTNSIYVSRVKGRKTVRRLMIARGHWTGKKAADNAADNDAADNVTEGHREPPTELA